jgi:hypothetical protein
MATAKLTGGCACGAVRYEITGAPDFSFLCQCRRCQRATGTGHAPGFKIERENLSVSGTLTSYQVEADSGYLASHEFCPVCGSPVFSSTERFPSSCSVYAASLDDPSAFEPERVIFHTSAQPWDYVDPRLAK